MIAYFPPGTRCQRKASDGRHPTWYGVVLADDDPRAWAGTIAFPSDVTPDPEAVKAHVARVAIYLEGCPVLWTFLDAQGQPYEQCYWERNPEHAKVAP